MHPDYESETDVVYNVHWRLNAESSETHEVDGEKYHIQLVFMELSHYH